MLHTRYYASCLTFCISFNLYNESVANTLLILEMMKEPPRSYHNQSLRTHGSGKVQNTLMSSAELLPLLYSYLYYPELCPPNARTHALPHTHIRSLTLF